MSVHFRQQRTTTTTSTARTRAAFAGAVALWLGALVALLPLAATPAQADGPLQITTNPMLPPAVVGQPYTAPLAASGGYAPYTWSVTGTSTSSSELINPTVTQGAAPSSGYAQVYGQPDFTSSTFAGGGNNNLFGASQAVGDSLGGVYVADPGNSRVLYYPSQCAEVSVGCLATRVYGQPNFNATGPGKGASPTSLASPSSVAVDPSGGLYVADTGNNRVLYFPASCGEAAIGCGAVRVFGQPDFTSSLANNGGGPTNSSLYAPKGLTVDTNGGLYVADTGNNRVLYFPPSCDVPAGCAATQVWGQPNFITGIPNNGRGGINASTLASPVGVATDGKGDLYIGDSGNNRVLFYSGAACSQVPAGCAAGRVYGQPAFTSNTANNGGISATSLAQPTGLMVDNGDNLWVADNSNNRILSFPSGATTAASVFGQPDFVTGAAGTPSASTVRAPMDVGPDAFGGLYVTDPGNNRVLYAQPGATAATRVLGQLSFNASAVNMGGTASLESPIASAQDASGGLYVSDQGRVLYFAPGATTATRVYGGPDFMTFDRGATAATFSANGLALDSAGGLYVADEPNNRVLYFPPACSGVTAGCAATRVYGQPDFKSNTANNGGLSAGGLNSPTAVAVDASGGLYVADAGNNRVLYFAPGATTATRVYGQPGFGSSGPGSGATGLRLSTTTASGVAVDGGGNLFVGDSGNNRVLYFPLGSTTATRVYGQPNLASTVANNGGLSATSLSGPGMLSADANGNLAVADGGNVRVLYFPAGSTVATAVYGQPDFNSTGRGLSDTAIGYPYGVSMDSGGGVFVDDGDNVRVLYLPPAAAGTAVLSYTPTGVIVSGTCGAPCATDTITVQVRDSDGASVSTTFSVPTSCAVSAQQCVALLPAAGTATTLELPGLELNIQEPGAYPANDGLPVLYLTQPVSPDQVNLPGAGPVPSYLRIVQQDALALDFRTASLDPLPAADTPNFTLYAYYGQVRQPSAVDLYWWNSTAWQVVPHAANWQNDQQGQAINVPLGPQVSGSSGVGGLYAVLAPTISLDTGAPTPGPSFNVAANSYFRVDPNHGLLPTAGDGQNVTLMAPPAHGTLNLNPDGSFVYQPNASYVGPDSFTYLASNGDTVGLYQAALSVVLPSRTFGVAPGGNLAVSAADGLLDGFNPAIYTAYLAGAPVQNLSVNANGSLAYTPAPASPQIQSLQYGFYPSGGSPSPSDPTATLTLEISRVSGTAACGSSTLGGATVSVLSGTTVLSSVLAGPDGSFQLVGLAPNTGYSLRYVSADLSTACSLAFTTDANGGFSAPSAVSNLCPASSLTDDSWANATKLTSGDPINAAICHPGQSHWYQINVNPQQSLTLSLRGAPAGYHLALYDNLGAIATELQAQVNQSSGQQSDGTNGTAAAPWEGSPWEGSPWEGSPWEGSPWEGSPWEGSPWEGSPWEGSAWQGSPWEGSPWEGSPWEGSPWEGSGFSNAVYGEAQIFGLLAVSDTGLISHQSTASATTWYVRVYADGTAVNPAQLFTLTPSLSSTVCNGSYTPNYTAPSGASGSPKTLILTNTTRLRGPTGHLLQDPQHLDQYPSPAAADFLAQLNAFAQRPEINGQVLDLAVTDDASHDLAADYSRWDQDQSCAPAGNLVASDIHSLIDHYRTPSLQYIVLAGDDTVIPFLRVADTAEINSEQGYDPGFLSTSESDAQLVQGYVLNQDYYGSAQPVSYLQHNWYLDGASVGRLVETSDDIEAVINAYESSGGIATPTTALVTGYDFINSLADSEQQQLTTQGVSTVELNNETSNVNPGSTLWQHMPDLLAQWFGGSGQPSGSSPHYGILGLNWHATSNLAVGPDYASSSPALFSSQTVYNAPAGLFTNTLVTTIGCHVGYNLPNQELFQGIVARDFTEAFAHQGATVVGNTGYGYGDTDSVSYSARLLANLTTQLGYYDTDANGNPLPTTIGPALLQAKHAYVNQLVGLTGVDQKAVEELTLYGLPMMAFNVPNRVPRPATPTVPAQVQPGGFAYADLQPGVSLRANVDPISHTAYYDDNGSTLAIPFRPLLPQLAVPVPQSSPAVGPARGVALISADYQDLATLPDGSGLPFTPTISLPTTDIAPVAPAAVTSGFAPWSFYGLNTHLGQQLILSPFQFRSNGTSGTGTARLYTNPAGTPLQLRVYYAGTEGAPAVIAGVQLTTRALTQTSGPDHQGIHVAVTVSGDTANNLADVLITYTALPTTPRNNLYGHWRSCSLVAASTDGVNTCGSPLPPTASTDQPGAFVYQGDLDATALQVDPTAIQIFAQVVTNTGLVSTDLNGGQYYSVLLGPTLQNPLQPSTLALGTPGQAGCPALADPNATLALTYAATIPVCARLTTATQTPEGLASQPVTFSLGAASVRVLTNRDGVAQAVLPVSADPGDAILQAAFSQSTAYLAAQVTRPASISPAPTLLVLSAPSTQVPNQDQSVWFATLQAQVPNAQGQIIGLPLGGLPVQLNVPDPSTYSVVLTDASGRVIINPVAQNIPVGTFLVHFGGTTRYLSADLAGQNGVATLDVIPTGGSPGATPELGSLGLFATGILGLAGYATARRRRPR